MMTNRQRKSLCTYHIHVQIHVVHIYTCTKVSPHMFYDLTFLYASIFSNMESFTICTILNMEMAKFNIYVDYIMGDTIVQRCGSYTCMHKNTSTTSTPPHRCIPHTTILSLIVIKWQKNINYGKNILSYEIYLELVPRFCSFLASNFSSLVQVYGNLVYIYFNISHIILF
jgi:hypothetical protein